MGVAISSSHVVSAAPSSSGGGLLTLFPCSSVGSHPREAVLHKLIHRESFPWAAVLCELLQHGSFPWGAGLQEQTAPAWAPLSIGPARSCSSTGFPWGHSLLWASTCPGEGSSTDCKWISAPPCTSLGCRGTACLTMVFTTGCRGISALVRGAPPPVLLLH